MMIRETSRHVVIDGLGEGTRLGTGGGVVWSIIFGFSCGACCCQKADLPQIIMCCVYGYVLGEALVTEDAEALVGTRARRFAGEEGRMAMGPPGGNLAVLLPISCSQAKAY